MNLMIVMFFEQFFSTKQSFSNYGFQLVIV